MLIMYMDFENSNPAVVQKCTRLMHTMEEIAPVYEHIFKVYWTQDPHQLRQRRLLGITWEELPSIGFNTLDHVAFPYPRENDFDKDTIVTWIKDLSRGKAKSAKVTDYSTVVNDQTIYEFFLEETLVADRQDFDGEILTEDVDSVVFFYSTENINY